MPPVEIDGNPITGATIDGQDVQEITVDGQTVFSAAPDVVRLSNLVAWYRMEGNANDETVNQPDSADTTDYGGTVNGGSFVSSDVTDVITGTTGDAYEFTGNEFIEYPFTNPPTIQTVCAWVYIIDKSDDFGIFTNAQSSNPDDVFFMYTPSGDQFRAFFDNGGFTGSSLTINTGQWYHYAATVSSSNIQLFINGSIEDTDTHTLGDIDNGSNYQTGDTAGGFFDGNGRIDDLRLYNTVLTQSEIQDIIVATEP